MCDSDLGSGGKRGGTSHSPVNPTHFRDGTPYFRWRGIMIGGSGKLMIVVTVP